MHGFLCIAKPAGMTSFDAVRRTMRAIGARKGGHAGTLDPFATGVLPIAIGEATKAVRYLHLSDKTYRATVRFGVRTETLDITGPVVETRDASGITGAAVAAALPAFVGAILQRPPAYSAVKVGGRRSYALAREGAPVEPPAREVAVHEARLISMAGAEALIEVRCGAGTYVRAIARDLGGALGSCAILAALVRTSYGPFTLADAVDPDLAAPAALRPIVAALGGIPAIVVDAATEVKVRHGATLDAAFFDAAGLAPPAAGALAALVDDAGRLVAVIAAPAGFPSGRCVIERGFNEKGAV